MRGMFYEVGYNATTFSIGDISKWNTSKVTDMGLMFYVVGQNATNDWSLNLTGWNVNSVTNHEYFSTSSRIKEPLWVN